MGDNQGKNLLAQGSKVIINIKAFTYFSIYQLYQLIYSQGHNTGDVETWQQVLAQQ